PSGDRHVLATASETALRLKPIDITGESLDKLLKRGRIATVRKGRSGETTRIVCGFLACDRRLAEPILLSLPRLFKVSMRDGGTAAWVQSSIRFSVAESASSRPGSAVVLARLSEVRGGSPLHGRASRGQVRMARGPARPLRRPGAIVPAREARPSVDT